MRGYTSVNPCISMHGRKVKQGEVLQSLGSQSTASSISFFERLFDYHVAQKQAQAAPWSTPVTQKQARTAPWSVPVAPSEAHTAPSSAPGTPTHLEQRHRAPLWHRPGPCGTERGSSSVSERQSGSGAVNSSVFEAPGEHEALEACKPS